MKQVELDDATFVALERLAAAKHLSPAGLITALLGTGRPPLAGDSLLFFLSGAEFSARPDATGRYLALLAWVARNYACDFADFISHQESGRRYLTLNRDEFNDVRARHQAVQLAGTQYWAVLNIDDPTKRRFLCRLLEFIGCHDETVTLACCSLGLLEAPGFHLRSG
jgi:negative modulator of initiation of replication